MSDESTFYGALSDKLLRYEINSDPYVMELRSGSDGHAPAQLQNVLLSRKTYCMEQLKGLLMRAEVIRCNVGIKAADNYIRACYARLAAGIRNSNSAWMPELSDKEKIHIASILEMCAL